MSNFNEIVDFVAAAKVAVSEVTARVTSIDASWKPFEALYRLGAIKIPGHRVIELRVIFEKAHAHARFAATSIEEAEKALSHAFQKSAENDLAAELGNVQVFTKSAKTVDELEAEARFRAEEARAAARLCFDLCLEFGSNFPTLKV
jgi:crotonobetainyl-CoA:carnitine CoA-transferase CaiB-like acyl-CoA transferase